MNHYFLLIKGVIVCKSCDENNGECGDGMVCEQTETVEDYGLVVSTGKFKRQFYFLI